ncbi:MAG: hypothetical protein EBS19_09820, partial [Spirochaetia bacterium]|nr:hypothetical protein [Spirochaetia bacterium]
MKIVSIFFLLIFAIILSAKETVFWSKENISVGEEVLLTIETDSNVSEIISPEIGLFSHSNELPFVEIMSATKDNTRILVQMRFTKSGKHELNIKWKNEENESSSEQQSNQETSSEPARLTEGYRYTDMRFKKL